DPRTRIDDDLAARAGDLALFGPSGADGEHSDVSRTVGVLTLAPGRRLERRDPLRVRGERACHQAISPELHTGDGRALEERGRGRDLDPIAHEIDPTTRGHVESIGGLEDASDLDRGGADDLVADA